MRLQPAILRKLNERRVLNTIRIRKMLSRTDIQRELNLTLPTISRIVDGLIEQSWVREVGIGDTLMGRPPMLVEINPEPTVAIGVELGRLFIRIVYVNLLAEILYEEQIPAHSLQGVEELTNYIVQSISKHNLKLKDIIGIGMAAPGSKNPHPGHPQRILDNEPDHHWQKDALAEKIQEQLGLPAWMENDANAAVLGEMWFGVGNSASHLVFVYADEGLGAGIAVNGSIYRGENNVAGEFAHLIVDIHGESVCKCGRRGCLGNVAHTMAIKKAVNEARNTDSVTVGEIIERATQGIEPEVSVISRTLDYLSVGILNLIQVIDPSMVILGGSTFLSDPYMITEMQRRIYELMHPLRISVVATVFGENAVAVGAATIVLQNVYDHTQLIENPS